MNKKFLVLVVIGTIVSVATYVGLNIVSPHSKEQIAADGGVTVDEVFSGGLQAPAATAPQQ